jgi:hypothetical protein
MKAQITKLIIIILTTMVSSFVNADITHQSNYTTDTATGLDWLDLTATAGLSVNQVLSSSQYNGWHYATSEQLNTLVVDFGGISQQQTSYVATLALSETYRFMIQTLGNTSDFWAHANGYTSYIDYLNTFIPDYPTMFTEGFLDVNRLANNFSYAVINDSRDLRLGSPSPYMDSVGIGFDHSLDLNFKLNSSGSFMVRASPVPLLPATSFFITGLLSLGAIRRKKNTA